MGDPRGGSRRPAKPHTAVFDVAARSGESKRFRREVVVCFVHVGPCTCEYSPLIGYVCSYVTDTSSVVRVDGMNRRRRSLRSEVRRRLRPRFPGPTRAPQMSVELLPSLMRGEMMAVSSTGHSLQCGHLQPKLAVLEKTYLLRVVWMASSLARLLRLAARNKEYQQRHHKAE